MRPKRTEQRKTGKAAEQDFRHRLYEVEKKLASVVKSLLGDEENEGSQARIWKQIEALEKNITALELKLSVLRGRILSLEATRTAEGMSPFQKDKS